MVNENTKKNIKNNLGGDTVFLSDLILIMARQLKTVIAFPLILCSFSIIYVSFFIDPVYTSISKIMSSSGAGNISQAAGIAAQFGINIPSGNSEQKWVYPEIIKSRTLAKEMLKKKFTDNKKGTEKTLLQILTNQTQNKNNVAMQSIAIDNLLSMIEVNENVATSILTLKINASDPIFAFQLNNTLIEELDSHQKKYNKAKTNEAKQFIEERIVDVEKELIIAEESLKIFMDRNRRIENSPSLQLTKQRLTREVTVLIGVFTTLKQQLETTKIEQVKESNYVIVLDAPEIPIKKSKPNKKSAVLLTGIISFIVGIFFAFLRDFFDNSGQEFDGKLKEARILAKRNISDLITWKSKK